MQSTKLIRKLMMENNSNIKTNTSKSVGVITMHKVINYGSFLQAYATQSVIENLGHKCEIIDYIFPNKWHIANGLKQKVTLKTRLSNYIYRLGLTSAHRKRARIEQAIGKYLKMSREYNNPADIKRSPPLYDVYITGSDQTWNTKHTQGDTTFLLSFAPMDRKKISFSASIAGKNLDERYKKSFKKYLSEYDEVSIRDSNGNRVISELIGKNASVTLDPTLVLNRKSWSDFGQGKEIKLKGENYIVFYLITHSFDPAPYIYNLLKKLQEKTGFKVYSFTTIPKEFAIEHSVCSDVNVEHFIQLFESAKYVVTSSFHGTAFAVNFGIPLYSVVNDINSTDDRQGSLLKQLGINNCLVPVGKLFEDINPDYDVESEQKELDKLRAKSIYYLLESI